MQIFLVDVVEKGGAHKGQGNNQTLQDVPL